MEKLTFTYHKSVDFTTAHINNNGELETVFLEENKRIIYNSWHLYNSLPRELSFDTDQEVFNFIAKSGKLLTDAHNLAQ